MAHGVDINQLVVDAKQEKVKFNNESLNAEILTSVRNELVNSIAENIGAADTVGAVTAFADESKSAETRALVEAALRKHPRYTGKNLEENNDLKVQFESLRDKLILNVNSIYHEAASGWEPGTEANAAQRLATARLVCINKAKEKVDQLTVEEKENLKKQEQRWKHKEQEIIRFYQNQAKSVLESLSQEVLAKSPDEIIGSTASIQDKVTALGAKLAEIQMVELKDGSEEMQLAQQKIIEVIRAKQAEIAAAKPSHPAPLADDTLSIKAATAPVAKKDWDDVFQAINSLWGAKAHLLAKDGQYYLYINPNPAINKGHNKDAYTNNSLTEEAALEAKNLKNQKPVAIKVEGDQLSMNLNDFKDETSRKVAIQFVLEAALAKSADKTLILEKLPSTDEGKKALAQALLRTNDIASLRIASVVSENDKKALFRNIAASADSNTANTVYKKLSSEDKQLFTSTWRETHSSAKKPEQNKATATAAPVQEAQPVKKAATSSQPGEKPATTPLPDGARNSSSTSSTPMAGQLMKPTVGPGKELVINDD